MQDDRLYYRNLRPEMTRFLPPRYEKVLEVGCGEGAFTDNLKPGCEVWGVERDERASKIAATRMKVVLLGDYDEVSKDLPDENFDLVICNDVIEHMADHDAFLLSVKRKLKPGGHLVASVPNVRFWENLRDLLCRKDWRYQEAGILDRTHLRFFTERSIRRALETRGFVIEELEGINPPASRKKILFLGLIAAATLGHSRDIRYLQYGLRARRSP